MKIAIFSGAPFAATGGGQMPTQLARQFAQLGHEVFFSQAGLEQADDLLAPAGVHVVPSWAWTRYPNNFWLPTPMRTMGPDWVTGEPGLAIVMMPSPFFTACALTLKANGWRIAYYTLDDWEGFAQVGDASWWSDGCEQSMLAIADRILATAHVLADKLITCDAVIGNGYDPERFSRGAREPQETFRIGYWGHLAGQWFDWDGLFGLALARPSWEIDLVGPDPRRYVAGLSKRIYQHNLYGDGAIINLPGEMPNDSLCAYAHARGWQAGIMPFRAGRILEAVSPIKGFEVLATGMPFVCPEMPEVTGWPNTIQVDSGATAQGWAVAIEQATSAPLASPTVVDAFLLDKTWAARARHVLEVCCADNSDIQ